MAGALAFSGVFLFAAAFFSVGRALLLAMVYFLFMRRFWVKRFA